MPRRRKKAAPNPLAGYERALRDVAKYHRLSARSADLASSQARLARQTAELYSTAARRFWR